MDVNNPTQIRQMCDDVPQEDATNSGQARDIALEMLNGTLPETNESHLKMDGWNMLDYDCILVGMAYFQVLC